MRQTVVALAVLAIAFPAAGAGLALHWIPGSTIRVEQIIGDCDYAEQARTGQCVPTTSRTVTRAKVLGTDLGASFESNGRLVFLFGDTLEPAGTGNYFASDTIATSTSTDPDAGLMLDFLTKTDGSQYFIRIPDVRMGAAEVPLSGIRLGNTTYVAVKTGADINAPDRLAKEYSLLTRFDEDTRVFTVLRTISSMPDGRFVNISLQPSGSEVLIFGLSRYRASNVYLASVPAATFESGAGTRYFTGLVNGQPQWSASERDAVPVVVDDPVAPSIGNVSVIYSDELGLWLMTFDGGARSPSTVGIWFAYATEPWGPWSRPQHIFNARRDGALGTFIHDPSILPNPPGDGLNGPTIGQNDPYTTNGASYAPYMIERFTRVDDDKLSISYLISTWNPYTVVRMRSDFDIVVVPSRRRAARH